MSLPSITHEITVGLGGETIYTRDYVYQYDNASDFFEVTIEGVADLLIFGEGITVTYELMRDGQKILALDEYPCELLLTGGAITKVLCALPSEIRKHYGYWSGQIHIYLGENRRSTDIFVFNSLPGTRPGDKIPGKPSGAAIHFDDFGLKLEAKPTVARAKQGEHDNGVGITAGESVGRAVSAVQGDSDLSVGLSNELNPIDRLIVLAELNRKIELESELTGFDAAAKQGEHNGGVETEIETSTATSTVERAVINTGAETDGFAEGRVSRGFFTEYEDENAGSLSAEGKASDVVAAELTSEYVISLDAEATVVNPQPPTYSISPGFYVTRTDIQEPLDAIEIALPTQYYYEGDTYTYSRLKVYQETESGYNFWYAAFYYPDYGYMIIGYFSSSNHAWEMLGLPLDPQYQQYGFWVTAQTAVTAEEYDIFYRYFRIYP